MFSLSEVLLKELEAVSLMFSLSEVLLKVKRTGGCFINVQFIRSIIKS